MGSATCANRGRLRHADSSGYTLLEVMTAVTLVSILAALAIPLYTGYLEKAKIKRAIVEIRYFAKVIDLYELDTGTLPPTMNLAGVPANVLDPWGNPYQYWLTSGSGGGDQGQGKGGGPKQGGDPPPGQVRKYKQLNPINTDYDLFSMGPDGKSAPPLQGKPGQDDIIRLDDGDFVGQVSDYL